MDGDEHRNGGDAGRGGAGPEPDGDRAVDPGGRRQLLVRGVLEARRADEPVTFVADVNGDGRSTDFDRDGPADDVDRDRHADDVDRDGSGDDAHRDRPGGDAETRVEFDDRTLRLLVDDAQLARLEELLDEYRVFKIQQPATRKAARGVVHLSAVTDAKHTADFLESLFREVYGARDGYELRLVEPEEAGSDDP